MQMRYDLADPGIAPFTTDAPFGLGSDGDERKRISRVDVVDEGPDGDILVLAQLRHRPLQHHLQRAVHSPRAQPMVVAIMLVPKTPTMSASSS